MGKIARLSPELANQIAAGEVVERPASVVKELLENALDAGATRVRVEVDGGGMARMLVSDDGEGMAPEDARMCLERHATSKLTRLQDLEALGTFGFRGEALPSIASVSRLTLLTARDGDTEGTCVTVHGVEPPRIRPAGAARGTSVEVRDLFYNVPARKKFLKATGTEAAHAGEAVLLAALARPDVSFTLVRDGKVAKSYLGIPTRRERAMLVLGGDLETVQGTRGPLSFEAFLSRPEHARLGATHLYLYVNGRPIRDRALARAVAHAYGSTLEPGRYPVGVVYLTLPPSLVDMNVHPQKAEVRFSDARGVSDALSRELHTTLRGAFSIPDFARGALPVRPAGDAKQKDTPEPLVLWHDGKKDPPSAGDPVHSESFREPEFVESPWASLRFLAQAKRMFLVCEGDDALYFLDQHAASERVTFHRLRESYLSRTVAMQTLLTPERVELSHDLVEVIEARSSDLLAMGVDIRPLGRTSASIHGIPQVLTRLAPIAIAEAVVAELAALSRRPFGDAVDLVLATLACHGSVRAGDVVRKEEAEALLQALSQVDFSGHCPHGRPVVTRISLRDLEAKVGR